MRQELYRFSFNPTISFPDIRRTLFLAVNAAESLHGRSLVRLEGLFYLNAKKRSCVVDAVTEVGRTISIIFTGFITDKFGEESFEVERDGTPECDSPSQYERLFKHLKDDLDNGV